MNNKSMILAGSFTIFLFFAAAVWWLLTPNWVALLPHAVSDTSQQNILLLLSKHNIEYKIDSDKGAILIKSPELKRAQLMLAENGQPEEASAGLEVFNSSDYGLSEFAQTVNYQRGMEEELSRTVRKLKGIKDARIHLTIKKDSIFEDRKLPPKATVVIKSVSGEQLSKESVRGIQQIIAAAVPNLQPHQVVVVTDAGKILSSTDSDAIEEDTSEIEDRFTTRITNLLEGILNDDEYKVSVNVVMDYKKKTTVEENYFPDMNTGKGFLAKKKTSDKTTTDAVSNSPQSNRNNEEEYLFSRERSEIIYPQAQLVKITVGLVVMKPISEVERDSLSKLIFTSLGMVESRGDKISIFISPATKSSNVQFISAAESQSSVIQNNNAAKVSAIDKFLLDNKYLLGVIFGVLVLLLLTLLILVMRSKASRSIAISEAELRKLSNDLKAWVNQ